VQPFNGEITAKIIPGKTAVKLGNLTAQLFAQVFLTRLFVIYLADNKFVA